MGPLTGGGLIADNSKQQIDLKQNKCKNIRKMNENYFISNNKTENFDLIVIPAKRFCQKVISSRKNT